MATPYALSSDLVSAWPAKSLEVAQYVDGYKLDTGPVQNAQTGTSYTFVLADTTKTVTANNAAASAYTVPPQSAVVWLDYSTLRILNLGAGVVTLTAGAGVTINGTATVAQYSSATLVRTASNTWTVAGSGAAPGMVLITPTSVAGTGVTLSGGQINFSGSTSISANGVFTSAYENYLVVHNVTGVTGTDAEFRARLRLAGTDAATSYATVRVYSAGSSVVAQLPATTSFFVGASDSGYPTLAAGQFTLIRPALAVATIMNAEHNQVASAGTHYFNRMSGYHSTATAYDGLTLVVSTGNATGTMRIYGMRNS